MLSWTKTALIGFATVAGSGCATAGTRPHDMSVAGHEKAANVAEAEAAEHAARPQQDAPASIKPTPQAVCRIGPCWREELSPSANHRAAAEKLRVAAAEHRKAAVALRDAERLACADLSEADRDLSPFFHRDDVERVEPAYQHTGYRQRTLTGATVVFAKVPGLSVEWMQKSLACHLARNAAMGFDAPEMAYCPLAPKGVHASARETNGHVTVEITAGDAQPAEEVLRRAQLLAPR